MFIVGILAFSRCEMDFLYMKIKEQFKNDIVSGKISTGTILPSIRKLSNEKGVSVITVMNAYKGLENDGYVKSVLGKGYIVNDINYEKEVEEIKNYLEKAKKIACNIKMSKKELIALIENETGE